MKKIVNKLQREYPGIRLEASIRLRENILLQCFKQRQIVSENLFSEYEKLMLLKQHCGLVPQSEIKEVIK